MVHAPERCGSKDRVDAGRGSESRLNATPQSARFPEIRLIDVRRSTTHRMNRTLVLVTGLAAGLATSAGLAQAAGPQAPATTAPAAVAPQAVPAKIALIEFEQAAAATNEG